MNSITTRRRLLKVVGVFFCTLGQSSLAVGAASKFNTNEQKTLSAFLNVLLPHDDFSGSASEFGVDADLVNLAHHDVRFSQLLDLGCQWLNMTGSVPFAELRSQDQIKIVEWMSVSDWNEIPRRFYELVRQTAVEAYYSKPKAWNGLPIHNPPQPLGYPPPWS